MSKCNFVVVRRFTQREGFSIWVWLLCLLLFTPLVLVLMVAHCFTDKIDMVEVEYKFDGDWFSKRSTMKLEEFEVWKEGF